MNTNIQQEQARLRALESYHILGTPAEEEFDDLARIAATICRTPLAFITLIDADRQWYKSCHGMEGATGTPRDIAFCDHAIRGNDLLVVEDTFLDPRFAENIQVTGDPFIRFYAGAPLLTRDGFALGTLCVVDTVPRQLDEEQLRALRGLARQVMTQIELRAQMRELVETARAREQAEALLRASEDRYRSLIETAHDIIYSTDRTGHFTAFNDAAMKIMRRTADEMLGLHFLELIDPTHRPQARRFYLKQFSEKTHNTYYEFLALTGDSEQVWLGQNVQLVLDGDMVTGFQAVARDITDRRRMELDLAVARDAALDVARMRSEFLANMSHEIRTPMNGIIGMTGLLLATEQTEEQREFTGIIENSANALLTIINDILDFSKIDAGQVVLEHVDTNLRSLIKSTVAPFIEPSRQKGLRLSTIIAEDIPADVCCDPGRIRQILNNLVGNAIKFTDNGDVTVRTSGESVGENEAMLRFEVVDTGIGISGESLPMLFEPFIQVDSSTTRQYGGTGLGLSISKRLVEMMGGTLGVRSLPGSGSTFWFTIRCTAAKSSVPTGVLNRRLVRGLRRATSPRILVAEDSPVNRKVTLGQLGALGYQADVVTNGREALEALEHRPYDVILMDCHMPEIDGFEATRQIRAREKSGEHVMIVALTADAMGGTRERCLAAGMDAYVTKPVDVLELEAVLDELCGAVAADQEEGELLTVHEGVSSQSEKLSSATAFGTRPEKKVEPARPSRSSPLDRGAIETLREISGEDGGLFVELIDLFLSDSPTHLKEIRYAAEEGDATRVAAASHKLCGSAGVLGAVTLAQTLASLENTIREGKPVDLRERADAIERELAEVMEALAAEKG